MPRANAMGQRGRRIAARERGRKGGREAVDGPAPGNWAVADQAFLSTHWTTGYILRKCSSLIGPVRAQGVNVYAIGRWVRMG